MKHQLAYLLIYVVQFKGGRMEGGGVGGKMQEVRARSVRTKVKLCMCLWLLCALWSSAMTAFQQLNGVGQVGGWGRGVGGGSGRV